MHARISVVINTCNEEKTIRRCLRSVRWADEIVLVDMHSGDRTVKIARQFGARVFLYKPTGYVEPARNFAIGQAKNEWVLVVDADEEIPLSLAQKLQELIRQKTLITHILIPRKNIVLGKWLKHSAEWANHQTRFFKKRYANWTPDIHRQPIVQGKSYRLPAREEYAIVHYYYTTIAEFIGKFDIYTTQHALNLLDQSAYVFKRHHLIIRPLGEFLQRYFIAQGFLDGTAGFIHCALMSFYYFLVYAKIWEKQLAPPRRVRRQADNKGHKYRSP